MFQIRNSGNATEIDIIGSIGEDWFGEGSTLETVKNQFTEITNDVTINVSSLGGDLIHALAIHDLFKAHPHRVTTNIIGATASAGTIIAVGGDNIKISENSVFLGHKASQMAWGNADDLRAAADDLEKFDSRIIAIYKKKTGKSKAEIENWLKEDKWITAQEAKDFGLVDEVYKAKKVLNTKELSDLSKIKPLPENFKQPEMENNETLKQTILNAIGFKNDAAIKAENEALKAEIESLKGQIANSADSATLPLKQEIENLKVEITNKASEYDTLKAAYDALVTTNEANEAEIARLKAGETPVNGADPVNPIGEPKPEEKPIFKPADGSIAEKYLNSAKLKSTINI